MKITKEILQNEFRNDNRAEYYMDDENYTYNMSFNDMSFNDIQLTEELTSFKSKGDLLINVNLRGYEMPDDLKFFKNELQNTNDYVKMMEGDYSKYDFNDVDISTFEFPKKSHLSNDTEFFQKIKNKNLCCTTLPEEDYSKFNFKDVNIQGLCLYSKSIIPADREFFQKVYDKSAEQTRFPSTDYTIYNFKGVNLTNSSILMDICKNIELYELNQFKELDFSEMIYDDVMSVAQANLVRVKYPDLIDTSIFLPELLIEPEDEVENEDEEYEINENDYVVDTI